MKILVLGGAGGMASGTVRDLVAPYSRNVTDIVVTDTSLQKAEALVTELGDARLSARMLDVSDRCALREALEGKALCM